jgi:D-alanine transfer protein
MKYCKKIIYIAIPVITAIIFTMGINAFFNKKINKLMNSKNISIIKNASGSAIKDKGVAINDYVNQNNDLIIQGSSELSSNLDQVITKTFPVEGFDKEITTYGRAYVQYLEHASILGSLGKEKENKNVVVLNSLQWFIDKQGISQNNFQSSFSPVQFYRYLNNEKISENNKIRYAKRVAELLEGSNQYSEEMKYAKLYCKDDLVSDCIKVALKPYYSTKKNIVELKDKGSLYKELVKLPNKNEIKMKEINWEEEYAKAEEEGKMLVTDNEFNINDAYYDQYFKDNIDQYKGFQKDVNLLDSREYEDYELYLDTCVDLGVRPYIILMPTNGLWYDYAGITKEERCVFYAKIQSMAEEKGFEVLNLQDEEYTPYFMFDSAHLGWKGWVRIDEEIYKKFK